MEITEEDIDKLPLEELRKLNEELNQARRHLKIEKLGRHIWRKKPKASLPPKVYKKNDKQRMGDKAWALKNPEYGKKYRELHRNKILRQELSSVFKIRVKEKMKELHLLEHMEKQEKVKYVKLKTKKLYLDRWICPRCNREQVTMRKTSNIGKKVCTRCKMCKSNQTVMAGPNTNEGKYKNEEMYY